MKAITLTGLTAVLLWTAPAGAHPGYHYEGGCAFTAVSDGDNGPATVWSGEMHALVVATDAAGAPAPAVGIGVACEVYVNGTGPTTVLTASGTGAAAGATTWTYQADLSDLVEVCSVVTVAGSRHATCEPWSIYGPVQTVIDLIEEIRDSIIWWPPDIWPDPWICDALKAAAPGVPGVVDVTPEGDVYIAGEFFWDCPPYAT